MLTTPIFRPWRPIWDAQLADATRRLDELAKERQKGRQAPPPVHDWSDVQRVLLALHLAKGAGALYQVHAGEDRTASQSVRVAPLASS